MLKMNKPDQKLRSTKRIKESNAQTRPRHHGGPARKHAPPCAIALVRTRNLVPSLYCTEKALTTKIMFWSKLPTPHSRGTPQALKAKLICTSRLSSGMKQKPAHNNPTPLYFTDKSSWPPTPQLGADATRTSGAPKTQDLSDPPSSISGSKSKDPIVTSIKAPAQRRRSGERIGASILLSCYLVILLSCYPASPVPHQLFELRNSG